MRFTLVVTVLLASGACSSPESVDGGGRFDGGYDAQSDPSCHWDCFGGASCEGGMVTVWAADPVPCWEWTGQCPGFPGPTCEQGCREDLTFVDNEYLAGTLCEESRPRVAGEPCDVDDDCLPTPATWDAEGNVTNTYLRCEAGVCVEADPPVVTDWLEPCGADLSGVSTGAYGYVSETTCSGGVCLIASDASCTDGFVEGCTIECSADWDCPPGSVCTTRLRNHLGTVLSPVCKPGPPGISGADLVCPPLDCATSFRCEAETAETECGVVTADGRRYPDVGAPYCSDWLSREGCACDLLRCTSPQPLCAGTYRMRARERLISGCNGVPGELSGTCDTLWNVAESSPDDTLLAERRLFNVNLAFSWGVYEHDVTLTEPTVVRMRVEQDAWFEDVSGAGNAGRAEIDWAELVLAP